MYSPPYIPPLYFVKRRNYLVYSLLKPPLCIAERGQGGEFMKICYICIWLSRSLNIEQCRKILTKYWGFTSFKPLQEDIIRSVGEGRDTLALMPTGGGKSITFQVPALAREGTCLVITPLIALMKEQVNRLNRLEIKSIGYSFGNVEGRDRYCSGKLYLWRL